MATTDDDRADERWFRGIDEPGTPPEPPRATPHCVCCGRTLPRARRTTPPVRVLAAEYPGLPVAEMLKRGWLGDDQTVESTDDLRTRILRFFDVETADELRHTLRIPDAVN